MYDPGAALAVLGGGAGVMGTLVAGVVTGRLPATGLPVLGFTIAGVAAIVAGIALLRLSMRRSAR